MTRAGSRILQGAREAMAIAKGEADPTSYVVHVPEAVDVKAIRRKRGLTQKEFAGRYGFSIGRVKDWEQHRSSVDTPSRILLLIIDKEPEVIERVLSAA
jgi:putative transcriptional regulator